MNESSNKASDAGNHSALSRYFAVSLILVGEYLILSFCFKAYSVIDRGGAWSVFGHVGTVGLVVILIALSAIFLRSKANSATADADPAIRWRLVWIHGFTYIAFFLLTWLTLGRKGPPEGPAIVWIGAWLLMGISNASTIIAALLGIRLGKPGVLLGSLASACIAGVASWQVGLLSQFLWKPLADITLHVSAILLRASFPRSAWGPEGVVLGLSDFAVRIDPPCSGFEGMGLATVLIIAYWIAFRRDLRFPNAGLLLPIGVLLAWIGNILRIFALMILGAFVNPRLAVGAFHSKAGWVMFCAIALTVGSLGRRSQFFSRTAELKSELSENPNAAFLMPLVVLVATALVTGLLATTYDRIYALRLITAAAVLFAFRRYYRELSWGWSWYPCLFGALVALMWIAIPGQKANPIRFEAAGQNASAGWLVLRALGSITIVPICEELAFRGFLLRWIVSRDFTRVSFKTLAPFAVLVSSLAFGLLHPRWIIASLAGVAYAVVQFRTGRVWDAVIAHGVSNAIIAIWVITTGDFTYWIQ